MKQLKMYRFSTVPLIERVLPDGYTYEFTMEIPNRSATGLKYAGTDSSVMKETRTRSTIVSQTTPTAIL